MKKCRLLSILAVLAALSGCNNGSNPNGDMPTSVSVTGVRLNQSTLTLTVGDTANLTATVSPGNAANKAVNWSSSDTGVATVSGGTVTAIAAGNAIIIVTTVDGGKTATCNVTVNDNGGENPGPSNPGGDNVPGNTLAAKLDWLEKNAIPGSDYIIELNSNESIGPQSLAYNGKSNITITLRGTGAMRTILTSNNYGTYYDAMFAISSGITLVLDNNITLQGLSGNGNSLVEVKNGGTLVMNTGSVITANTLSSYDFGGGVYVGGTFTMNGGTIIGNTSSNCPGGGVYVDGGTFTMSDGIISGNSSSGSGGGVSVSNGTFTMNGGTISNNTAYGGNGIVSKGGGVSVSSGTFTMTGGIISDNTASCWGYSAYGGGVYVDNATFVMSGGTISGNTAFTNSSWIANQALGGGVYVSNGTFTKTGGTIIGGELVNGNSAIDGGHAVYANTNPAKVKNTTSGPGDNLSVYGSAASGDWDE